MNLAEKISADFIQALKKKEELVLAVLRQVKAAIKNQEIANRHPLAEAEIIAVIKKLVKQLAEVTADFERGGRGDLVAKNLAEIKILQGYLPAVLSDEEARQLVSQAVLEARAAGLKDFGPIMGAVMKKAAGRLEGARVKQLMEKVLQE